MSVAGYRVLPAQERMFVLDSLKEGAAYAIPFAVLLEGALSAGILRRAVCLVVERHEALLSRYVMDESGVVAQLSTDPPELPVEEVPSPADTDAWIAARMRRLLRQPFRLGEEGPLRLCIARFAPNRHALVMAVHHIAWDAHSGEIFRRELLHCYSRLAQGQSVALQAPSPALADLARAQWDWLESPEAMAQREWWRRTLSDGLGREALPLERGARGRGHGIRATGRLGGALTAALRARAAAAGVTTFAVVGCAVAATIGWRSAAKRVVLGVPVSSRTESTVGLIGPFINTLAIPIEVAAPGAELALERAYAAILAALEHRQLPYDHAVRGMSGGGAEAFDVLCAYEPRASGAMEAMGIRARVVHLTTGSAQADVCFHLMDEGDDIVVFVDADSDRFLPATAGALVDEFRQAVAILFAYAPASSPPPLRGATCLPLQLLPDVFAEVCARQPDAIALRESGRDITYAKLDGEVGRLAGALVATGVASGDLVAVQLPRSVDSVVASLAAWRAGCAFLPLDPADGSARLASILRIANPKAIVTCDATRLPEAWRTRALTPDACGAPPAARMLHKDAVAYVLFTSGSTGQPKGAMVSHAAIANRIAWMRRAFPLSLGECVLHKSPLVFDVSLQEYLWPLASGAVSAILPPGGERDPVRLMQAATQMHAVAFHLVPDMLRDLLDTAGVGNCASLRWVLCSGDVLSPDLAARFIAESAASLVNLYGPTEAAIDVSWFVCDGDAFPVPIGQPVDNVALSVRDPTTAARLPSGAVGELYIGGAQVGLGYLSARETADRFIPDPDGAPGARMYRTGDLCRVRVDGLLEFKGRADRQMKIAGHRIEPAEVEETLRLHPDVREAVVGPADLPEERHLIAWYVPAGPDGTAAKLRPFLRERLPAAAVPSRLIAMDALPMLPSGKLDRAALPMPELEASWAESPCPDGAGTLETDSVARTVATIWRELLGVEQVRLDDDFFALGGDSLRALQSVVRARRRGIAYTLSMLIDHPTPQSLAAVAASVRPDAAARAASAVGEVPLVAAQAWFFDLEHERPDHWNLETTARLVVAPRRDRLVTAVSSLAHAHEALRLRFHRVDGIWRQTLADTGAIPVEILETDGEAGRTLLAAVADDLHATLSLEHGPLAAVLLARDISTGKADLVLIVHHLASDAFSMGLLMDDLIQAAYTGAPVPARPGFAHWSRSAAAFPLPKQSRLLPRDLPFGLPVDHALYRNRIADAQTLEQIIVGSPIAAFGSLRDARRLGVVVAAVGRAICTLADEPACLLEVERHGREGDSDLAGTVGWLTRFVPVVVRGGTACEPAASLRCADESLANEGEMEGRAEALVNYLGSTGQTVGSRLVHALGPSRLGCPRHAEAKRSHLLEIDCWFSNAALLVRWTYGGDVYTPETMERLAAALEDQIGSLSAIAAASVPAAIIEAGVALTPSELKGIFRRFGNEGGSE